MRIGVVGGSLGGLTTACLLRDAGFDVTAFERSSEALRERGAGIGYLEATGRYLAQRSTVTVDEMTVATDNVRYLERDGSVGHQYHYEYFFSSWNTVFRHMSELFPADRYRLDHELVDFEQTDDGVVARFANGTEFRCDLLVAADGIGSVVRARLQPAATAQYAGYVAWRGTVPETEVDEAVRRRLVDAVTYYLQANSHVLVYPVPNNDGSVTPGERLLNFVWYRNYLEGGELDDLLTDRQGRTRELSVPPGAVADHHVAEMRATAAARLPPQFASVIEATEQPFLQTIYDIEVERMAFGRICLLGDAAFAVRPHAAAGTAKAADDAWALADALTEAEGSVVDAMTRWEPGRLALGRELLDRCRRIGRRSQLDNSWKPDDPDFIFRLHESGDPHV